jgi:hypothetical protein
LLHSTVSYVILARDVHHRSVLPIVRCVLPKRDIRETEDYKRLVSTIEPSQWPPALTKAIESGEYIFWRQAGEWVFLLSMKKDDVSFQRGEEYTYSRQDGEWALRVTGTYDDTLLAQEGSPRGVQARLAIHLRTGETRRSPLVVADIGEWEAELAGNLAEYRELEQEGHRRLVARLDALLKERDSLSPDQFEALMVERGGRVHQGVPRDQPERRDG